MNIIANLGNIINEKNQSAELWQAQRQADRENTNAMQDAGIVQITSNPETYLRYLNCQADNPSYSAGNVALVMVQDQGATVFGTKDRWKSLMRSVSPTEEKNGVKIFTRSSFGKGYTLTDVYDVRQTAGRDLKHTALQPDSKEMTEALKTLLNYSVVPLVSEESIPLPAIYDPNQMKMAVNPKYGDAEAFAGIAIEIAHVRFNHEVEVFTALRDYMNEGNLARTFECSEDDAAMIATSDLLTLRKTIYAANLSENDVNQPEACKYFTQVQALAAKEGSEVLPICAKLEADIAELDDPDEKAMFMEELGLQQSGLDRLIQCSYELLGLISFLTAGADECRAWTIKKGTKAPQAAGKIHSDFERGFIRAEVIAFDDLKACGTLANAKAKGLLRSEGKEYVMHDGDVVNFLFNV